MRGKKNISKSSGLKETVSSLYKKADSGIRQRLPRIALLGAALLLLYGFFGSATGFIKIARMHLEKERLKEENQELLVKLVDAEITKKRLQSDMKFIEHIARTRHFMSRPGEVIYRFKK